MHAKNRTLLILAVLALTIMLTACGRKTIVIKDYVTFEASGFNTAGKLKYKFEGEKLIEDNLDVFGLDTTDGFAALSVLANLDKHLKGSLDREDGLSNGDQVTFHWKTADVEELEEKYDASFELNDISYTVSGLQEAQQFDPFDYLEIAYDGISPKATVRLTPDSKIPVSGISFTADRKSDLANGDTITVSFGKESESVKDRCFQLGYIPTQTEKSFTVEGLSEYVQTLDALPEDAYQKMNQHAQDCLTAKYASSYSKTGSELKKIELIGNYLLTPKDPSVFTMTHKQLYFVYQITAADTTEGAKENQTFRYYWYASYSDIIILEDGTCSFNLKYISVPEGAAIAYVVTGEAFIHGKNAYTGYEDLDSLFNKHITSQIGTFKYESTVKIP